MSRESAFQAGKPIRGGVPICFPWFGPSASDREAPAHGFARLCGWTLVSAREHADETIVVELELAGRDLARVWPHEFRLVHRVSIGSVLRMDLEVFNTGAQPFTFEEALHTYFDVDDVSRVTVSGLQNTEYLDKVAGFRRSRQGAESIRFAGETDRIYLDTQAACVIEDPGRRRRITVRKSGSDATVVWNPWVDKARAMADFGDEEWRNMLCVETCNVNVHARTLAPGASHTMTAIIEAQDE
jgi:D-hexose-6-phosphate mutarotase